MINTYHEIKKCRICKGKNFDEILNLGNLCYTGRFLEKYEADPLSARLALVKCNSCGLIQLRDIYPNDEMYGMSYGYRSAITDTMKRHLSDIVEFALASSNKKRGLVILDIGSNDGTLLNMYDDDNYLVGIDPCADKHKENYPAKAKVISDFFSEENLSTHASPLKFDIITSIAMFYDLNDPVDFAKNVSSVLNEDGIWITEQTHSHTLVESNAYDSICHEHATYLSLASMENICNEAGLKILNISTNSINGGSFTVLIAKEDSTHIPDINSINEFRKKEDQLQMNDTNTWDKFNIKVYNHRNKLKKYLTDKKNTGKKIFGYGASTKGNVLLQFCNITTDLMPYILERDPNKYGLVTPGTRIPVISEEEGRKLKPDILVVFPWHFREEIIDRELEYVNNGGTLLFPLPELTIIDQSNYKTFHS